MPPNAPNAEARPACSFAPRDERVLICTRASVLAIVLRPFGWFVLLVAIVVACLWYEFTRITPISLDGILILAISAAALILIGSFAKWWTTWYALTDQRMLLRTGILRTLVIDVPRSSIISAALHRRLRERLFGLGTIGVSTAAGGVELVWDMLPRPQRVLDTLRQPTSTVVEATPAPSSVSLQPANLSVPMPPTPPSTIPDNTRLPVIGIAGGIGSGKSFVAQIFGELGCRVIDSDGMSKDALIRPDIRDRLVEWWGSDILTPATSPTPGQVDRSKIAKIVFADATQRARLESLIHPIVRQGRAAMVADALAQGAKAAIVDAPLLFEVGLDQECDAVVFVCTPREVRVRRVCEGRGWTAEELERRESAQWSLERKKAASSHVVDNSQPIEGVRLQVRQILADVLSSFATNAESRGRNPRA